MTISCAKAYAERGFDEDECEAAAKFSAHATTHGIRTHNALKALHLDDLFGSKAGGCKPSATIIRKESRFAASEVWDCQYKLGQATAYEAMNRCMELADQYGIGQVSVDHAFHYLWGGGYVMDAAKRGYTSPTPTAPHPSPKSFHSWEANPLSARIHIPGVSQPPKQSVFPW